MLVERLSQVGLNEKSQQIKTSSEVGKLGTHTVTPQTSTQPPPEQIPTYPLYQHMRGFTASPSLAGFGQIIKDIASAIARIFTFWKAPSEKAELPASQTGQLDYRKTVQEAMKGNTEQFLNVFRQKELKENKNAIVEEANRQFETVKNGFNESYDMELLARAFLVKKAAAHFSKQPPSESITTLKPYATEPTTQRKLNNEFAKLVQTLEIEDNLKRAVLRKFNMMGGWSTVCSIKDDLQ